jgi:hypothetical protein
MSFLNLPVSCFLQTSLWQSLYPSQVVGEPAMIKEIDCLTVTLEDVKEVAANYRLPLFNKEDRVSGFAGWFDVQFKASGMWLCSNLVHCASIVCHSLFFTMYRERYGLESLPWNPVMLRYLPVFFIIPGALL